MLRDNAGHRTGECRSAQEHVPKRHAERINVGTDVFRLAIQLFGAREIRRANKTTGCNFSAGGRLHHCRSGEAEIDHFYEDLAITLLHEHEVGWFDVTVDKVLFLRSDQRGGDLLSDIEREKAFEWAVAFYESIDRFTIDEFHRIEIAIAVFTQVEN